VNGSQADDDADAMDAIRGSRAWQFGQSVARVWTASAADSLLLTMVRRFQVRRETLPRGERARATAVAVSVATAVHALLVGLVPAQLRPAVPRLVWVLVSIAAAAVAASQWAGKNQASDK